MAAREDEGLVEWFDADFAKREAAHVFDVLFEGGQHIGGRHGGWWLSASSGDVESACEVQRFRAPALNSIRRGYQSLAVNGQHADEWQQEVWEESRPRVRRDGRKM